MTTALGVAIRTTSQEKLKAPMERPLGELNPVGSCLPWCHASPKTADRWHCNCGYQ
jgi:hypothetical protein